MEAAGSRLIPLALAFELIHTATLIHDDIIDGDLERRGKPSLNAKLKDKAIIVGDSLFVKAVEIASAYGVEVVKTIALETLNSCNGEYMDVTLGLQASEGEVVEKVRQKSATLFRAAAYCGSLVGGGTRRETEALRAYGENFGVAYQLADDLQEVEEGSVSDLKAGRVTLPLIHLYQNGSPQAVRLLTSIFGSGMVSVEDARRLRDLLHEYGSLEYCRRRIAEHVERALESLTR